MNKQKHRDTATNKPNANGHTAHDGNGNGNHAHNGNDNGGNGNHDSNGNGHGVGQDSVEAVPKSRFRVSFTPPTPTQGTQESPTTTQSTRPVTSNGNGYTPAAASVRPVKARVGPGNGNGNGYHPENDNGTGNGIANGGYKARVSLEPPAVSVRGNTTSHLRESDLYTLRLRLKTSEWQTGKASSRRGSVHKRELPYFLMRHRHTRARSKVGHTRAQVSLKRFGRGGAATLAFRLFILFQLLMFVVVGTGVGSAAGGVVWYIDQMPKVTPDKMVKHISDNGIAGQTTRIFDRNGTLLYDLVDETTGRREEVALKDISPLVISATIAAEDANFYTNPGVDLYGIVRAVTINLSGEGQSGASTITQQLVRQVVLDKEERNERTFNRKIKEAVIALKMTQENSKDDIMEMFLNQNYYGHLAYGISAAARIYFDKEANNLTLSEAALLAGLPQAPSEFDPIVNPDTARRRKAIVLDLMVKQEMVTREQADAAKNEDLSLSPYTPPVIKAPHFVYYVKEHLEEKFPHLNIDTLGWDIYTTLDLDVQMAAEKVAKDRIDELRKQKATNCSIVVMKPGTGEILAMVGSVDYYNTAIDGQVNVSTRERQPGSSFKPITFAAAFKKGWTPATVVLDALTAFPNPGQKPYVPNNYDGRDHGYVTIRESLGNSFNVPAVKGMQFAGVQEVIDTAHDMGVKGLNRGLDWYGLSLTLGGGEVTLLDMTTAYSTFANGGVAADANPILRIEDPQKRVVDVSPPPPHQALDPRHAFMITSILSDNKARTPAFGPNSALKTSFPSAAKTGTTDNNRDSWTMGYTPNLTVGVWVGNSNNDEMLKVTGAIGAATVWNKMMETFYANPDFVSLVTGPDGKLQRDFVEPAGLVKATACSSKGNVTDLFLQEDLPGKKCVTYQEPKTNKQMRSLATPEPKQQPQQQQPRQQPRQQPQPEQQPAPKPTPMPGIWPPLFPQDNPNTP